MSKTFIVKCKRPGGIHGPTYEGTVTVYTNYGECDAKEKAKRKFSRSGAFTFTMVKVVSIEQVK